ncbi:protein phosphatase 1 regulatory subunit 3B [Pholidichthys leucotaenia]
MVFTTSSSALCILPPEPTMPIDMTLPLYLSKEEFVYSPTPQTSKSALRFQRSTCVDQAKSEDEKGAGNNKKPKKQVTFADHKGLSLTKVKVFSQLSDPIDIPVSIQKKLSLTHFVVPQEDKLVLGFSQPSSDYLLFRQNLERNFVCLEHCVLKEEAFTGTVKVKNVSFEKVVKLRVTFDKWRSYTDVDCTYMKDSYPSSHHDTFSFEVLLPAEMPRHEGVEFAICYEAGGCKYWDSNQGNNYSIIWSSMKQGHQQSHHPLDFGIHFDRYGSPTCSHGIFPDWPSYAGYENIGPYY